MASIRQRPNGAWYVQVRVFSDGKLGTVSRTARTKREAQRFARDLEGSKDKGRLRAGRSPTVEDFAEQWLAGIEPPVKAYETWRGYRVNVRRHITPPLLGDIRLRDLAGTDVQKFVAHLLKQGLAPRTVRYAHAVLHLMLEAAMFDNRVTYNAADKTTLPRLEPKDVPTLTEERLSFLLREAEKTRLIAPVVLSGLCGLRRGEACGLRWQDLDLDGPDGAELTVIQTLQRQTGRGVVAKSPESESSRRRIPLLPCAVPYLRRWQTRQKREQMAARPTWRGTGYVCTTLEGGPLDPQELDRSFRRLVKSIGLPGVTFHGLRHTFATLAIKNGADIRWVQAVLGHKTAAFTLKTYTHATAASLRQTAKALDAKILGGRREEDRARL